MITLLLFSVASVVYGWTFEGQNDGYNWLLGQAPNDQDPPVTYPGVGQAPPFKNPDPDGFLDDLSKVPLPVSAYNVAAASEFLELGAVQHDPAVRTNSAPLPHSDEGQMKISHEKQVSHECPVERPEPNSYCAIWEEGLSCRYGEECCCGECHDSTQADCFGGIWSVMFLDICMRPRCGPKKTCTLTDGTTVGHTWSGKDDCNDCHCNDGNLACTMMFCGPKKSCTLSDGTTVVQDGWSGKDDCNDCRCYDGNLACTMMFCGGSGCPSEEPRPGAACWESGLTCRYGQEYCCGEWHDSVQASCEFGSWALMYLDICFRPSCDNPPEPALLELGDGLPDTSRKAMCEGVVCAASADACHEAGVCDLNTGACSGPVVVPDGTSCDDGDATTMLDQCTAGVCAGFKHTGAHKFGPKTCTLNDGTTVQDGWSGKPPGDCNTCRCNDGALACTRKLCGDGPASECSRLCTGSLGRVLGWPVDCDYLCRGWRN